MAAMTCFGVVRAQGDHRAAPAAAGQLGAEGAVLAGDLDQLLEFPARDLEPVEQTLTDVHEFAEAFEIVLFDGLERLQRDGVDALEHGVVDVAVALAALPDPGHHLGGQAFDAGQAR